LSAFLFFEFVVKYEFIFWVLCIWWLCCLSVMTCVELRRNDLRKTAKQIIIPQKE
jgi:hypothetical protein